MPPYSTPNNILQAMVQPDFDSTFMHQHEETVIRTGDMRKAQLATPEWNHSHLYGLAPLAAATSHRLNVKTHVFKKELQEYIPTQIEDRLRIETIIYVELSIIDQTTGELANVYDYLRLPKALFLTQADKVMSAQEMDTKRILNIAATLQCPSNGWKEETEACLRCARRMSAKSDVTESRILHLLPELHRTQDGDELISFRNGIANIQFKVNCYCGHKREKQGFVIRFDSVSDTSIASHVTLPLMFYHQNKNRLASRALAAAAKAQAKAERQQQQQEQEQEDSQQQKKEVQSTVRNIVKSVTSTTRREPRSHGGRGVIGNNHHQIPSPPNSLIDSPTQQWSPSSEMDEFMDSSELSLTVSPPPPDPVLSLFPENATIIQEQAQAPRPMALITHMTPNSGPTRGGTLVTIHGSGFTVGEVVYVSFGGNFVPIIPQRDHILECFTPAALKADTVPVLVVDAVNDAHAASSTSASQISYTYVDDSEKELIKLALQRMMNITARMNGPLENVLHRANDFALWSDLLDGSSSLDSSNNVYQNLEKMVIQSMQLVDPIYTSGSLPGSVGPTASNKNVEYLNMVNSTGHTMLHLAVILQYEALTKDLVDRGVDLTLTDKNGMTALDWAHQVKNDALVAIFSAMDTDVTEKQMSLPVVDASASVLTKGDEVAQHLQSLECPSVGCDQDLMVHSGPGGILLPQDLSVSQVKHQSCTTGHDDTMVKTPWEDLGQDPEPVHVTDSSADPKSLDVNVYQALQHLPDNKGVAIVDKTAQPRQDEATLAQKYQDPSLMSAASNPLDYSPVPQLRLPKATAVVQAAGVTQEREMNIPIQPVTGTISLIDDPTLTVRQAMSGLDHCAPNDQGVVAVQGCTGDAVVHPTSAALSPADVDCVQFEQTPGSSVGHWSAGIQQQSIQNTVKQDHGIKVQSTSRIDDALPVDVVRHPVQDTDVSVVEVVQQNARHRPISPCDVVTGDVVSEAGNEDKDVVNAGSFSVIGVVAGVPVKQAAVQSGRYDVSEQPLFLGGLPVTPRDHSRVKPPRTESDGEHVQETTSEHRMNEHEEEKDDKIDGVHQE
ncbi:SPT3 Dosage dependent suppressor of Ty-induced promoter mutations-like protein [Podila epigama]|nr:SPT3 Dosage dependent suppressor of Ty-induced promoter mutations-like protein [Podila epigama]